jgi:hypothetical protein
MVIDERDQFAAARARVLGRIEAACARAGRDPDSVTVVAVSKTVPVERLEAAVAAGLNVLGENRVQEAAAKAPLLAGATWHLVGPLQTNKVRRAVELFDVIESVDSAQLGGRLDRVACELRQDRPLPVLIQVNVDGDASKAGFDPDVLRRELDGLARLPGLQLRGLMTIGRLVATADEARSTFRALRELSASLRAADDRLGPELSMGMSDDFDVAVEEGATIVRLGRVLFGERPPAVVGRDAR